MIISVHMLAFTRQDERPKIRRVEIPFDGDITMANESQINDIKELTFWYGQNEHQARPMPSVSVGDVAEIDGRYFMVIPVGWKELSSEEFKNLKCPTSQYAYMSVMELET